VFLHDESKKIFFWYLNRESGSGDFKKADPMWILSATLVKGNSKLAPSKMMVHSGVPDPPRSVSRIQILLFSNIT